MGEKRYPQAWMFEKVVDSIFLLTLLDGVSLGVSRLAG
jgi:hypothetical protein